MHESTTYQGILDDGEAVGRTVEAHRMLLRMGTKRFGSPDPAARSTLEAIGDIDRLEALGERLVEPEVRDWVTFLQAP